MVRRNMALPATALFTPGGSPMKFDPFSQWGKVFETWQKLTDDSIARTTAFYAELEKAEAKRIERAESAIEEIAKLQKETVAYGAQLTAELRKVSLEAIKNAQTSFAASASASATPAA
jgi:hypothetical protein